MKTNKINIIKIIFALFLFVLISCEKKTDKYAEVRNILEKVMDDDQRYRQPFYDDKKQNPLDRKNVQIVTKIIDSLGWLGKDKIGEKANEALFIVIQHSYELSTKEKYLPIMKDAVKKGNAEKSNLAYLIDRFELLNNRKQIYGTQPTKIENGKTYIENIIDPENVNKRRKSMNLEPIEDYIKSCDSIDLSNYMPRKN